MTEPKTGAHPKYRVAQQHIYSDRQWKVGKNKIPLSSFWGEKRGIQEKKAATYSPTVTQYHRRGEA